MASADALALAAKTVRILTLDAVRQATIGHVGLPLGCAEIGVTLFSEFLRHDPADPRWPDRDRFVLTAGHGSMLLYSLLHLSGYGISIDDIRKFRQLGSITPGHPENGLALGVNEFWIAYVGFPGGLGGCWVDPPPGSPANGYYSQGTILPNFRVHSSGGISGGGSGGGEVFVDPGNTPTAGGGWILDTR